MAWLLGMTVVAEEDDEARYREVIVRVVNEQGAPMPGVTVHLVGTERDAEAGSFDQLQSEPDKNAPDFSAWRFVSDAQGRFVARFWCFETPWDVKPGQKRLPGWGFFYFVAESAGLRGVSSCVAHEGARDSKDGWLGDYRKDEWTRTKIVRTRSRTVQIKLRMRRGLRVEGRVIDREGRPVRNFEVGVHHDLHAGSHTGYGGEIFAQRTFSDSVGRFSFDGVYPNTFYVVAPEDEGNLPVWAKTRVRQKWVCERVDVITPRHGEKRIRLTLEVSPRPYRYYGQILDWAGKPVRGAMVTVTVSRHRKPQTFGDERTSRTAISGEDGRYEILTASPFLSSVFVEVPDRGQVSENYEDEGKPLRGPGELNMVMGFR